MCFAALAMRRVHALACSRLTQRPTFALAFFGSPAHERHQRVFVSCERKSPLVNPRTQQAGNFPKHRTIRDFRALHLKQLADLFVQVVKLAQEMGLIKPARVAIDGTKIKVNASRHKTMSPK